MDILYEYEPLFLKEQPILIQRFIQHNSCGRVHWHEAIEMLYFTQGRAVTSCNLQEYTIKKGEILLVNGNELHTAIISQVDSVYYCLQFDPSLIHNLVGNDYLLFQNIIRDENCNKVLDELVKTSHEKKDYKNRIKTKRLSLELFSLLAEHHVKEILDEETYEKQFKKLNTYNSIVKYLDKHYAEDLNINLLAQHFHMSSSYFAHFFKKHAQKSVIEYLNELRITYAKQYLEKEEASIGEIATRVGFSDINYFSRKFKTVAGVTPTEYRKSFQ